MTGLYPDDAPDVPPVLTAAMLRESGHAREVTWVSGKTTRTAIRIDAEGHRLLGENQRIRAERNQRWRSAQQK